MMILFFVDWRGPDAARRSGGSVFASL